MSYGSKYKGNTTNFRRKAFRCAKIPYCPIVNPTKRHFFKGAANYGNYRHQIPTSSGGRQAEGAGFCHLDNVFAVHDIKIIDGQDRLFLAMPSRRMPDGKYRDIVHPIGPGLRAELEEKVITAYHNTLPQ